MFAHFALQNGWHYNKTYNIYQKVNGRVFVYVSKVGGSFYMVQLYIRGRTNMGTCQLEARTVDFSLIDCLFELGEKWLKTYSNGDLAVIHRDTYSISNPLGAWGIERHLEKYWIKTRGD